MEWRPGKTLAAQKGAFMPNGSLKLIEKFLLDSGVRAFVNVERDYICLDNGSIGIKENVIDLFGNKATWMTTEVDDHGVKYGRFIWTKEFHKIELENPKSLDVVYEFAKRFSGHR